MSDIQQFILSKLEKLDEKLDEVREHSITMKAAFDTHAVKDEEIHKEVLKLGDNIGKHSGLLGQYNQQLEEHMRRTEILEERVLPLVEKREEQQTLEKWRDNKLKTSMKVLGWLSAIGGFIVIILEISSKL